MTINIHSFTRDLQREALPLRIQNKIYALRLAFHDIIYCIPDLYTVLCGKIQRPKSPVQSPNYLPLNKETIRTFNAFPEGMSQEIKTKLIENLSAIQNIFDSLHINPKIYYCTISDPDTPAKALSTGEIIFYDDICMITPKAAQAIALHEWSHITHKDGYWQSSLSVVAAITRIVTLFTASWPLFFTLSALLSYTTAKHSQYCEYRADREAVERLGEKKAFLNYLLSSADFHTHQTIEHIEKANPHSYCNVANYKQLSRDDRLSVIFKVSDLGIQSISVPTFAHPSWVDRYLRLKQKPLQTP